VRSAYACERYAQLTGAPAPVVPGERLAAKEDDKAARQVLSQEPRNQRTDVNARTQGMTQRQSADFLGRPHSVVGMIETDHRSLKLAEFILVAVALGQYS
jgi:hypothetical protein